MGRSSYGARSLPPLLRLLKLKGDPNGAERSIVVPAPRQPLLQGGDGGILEPGFLMGIVQPPVDDIAVPHLLHGIDQISPAVLPAGGHGKGGEHVVSAVLFPRKIAGGIGPFPQKVVGGGIALAVLLMQHPAGDRPGRAPTLRQVLIDRPQLDCLGAMEAGIRQPEEMVNDDPPLLLPRHLHSNASHPQLRHVAAVHRLVVHAAASSPGPFPLLYAARRKHPRTKSACPHATWGQALFS